MTEKTAPRESISPLAGKPAPREMLVDIGRLEQEYSARKPDIDDPTDAVVVGDYHLPHVVAYSLAGEPRATDERMLELLAPYAGQRARVQRLLVRGGARPPRRGARLPLRSIVDA